MANTPFPEDAIDCGYYPGSLGAINVQDESESQERYDEGLYYPVSIGEVLAGRYRIEHKLGWGGFSTVWMAYDTAVGKSVALKIMTPGEDGDHEFQIQNEIGRAVRDTSNLITHRGGSFSVSGRNGIYHQVLVLPLVGPSLGLRLPNMPIRARMSAAKQLLVALKTFHEAGFIHRDLNEGALMWELPPDFATTDTARKYQLLGRPKKYSLDYLHKAGEMVAPVRFPLHLLGGKVYLGDFGLTIRNGTSAPPGPQAPYGFCAPERFHGIGPSFASDVWSYMHLFTLLYLGYRVFYGNGGRDTVFSWFEHLGPMPEQWKGRFFWSNVVEDAWYDPTMTSDPKRDLAFRIAWLRPETSQVEREHVLSVMRKGLCYLPEQRITAAELLRDPSFIALMKIYQC